ncbi:MAG TPA: response regulator [Patescibacteria group bacterium]|nr:response regulator [Patescibacteria group bacterium]
MAKILVIEDEPDVRNLYASVLQQNSFQVDTAEDGEQGLNKIRNGGYNLILLDVMLPKMDAITVLRELSKQGPKNPNGPIVLLTNLSQEPIFKEADKLGAKYVILKTSVNPDQLVEKVKQMVV